MKPQNSIQDLPVSAKYGKSELIPSAERLQYSKNDGTGFAEKSEEHLENSAEIAAGKHAAMKSQIVCRKYLGEKSLEDILVEEIVRRLRK